MAYTDDPLYANYASRANADRSDEHKISVNALENLPGVGRPAPTDKKKTNIVNLIDEQQYDEGGAKKEARPRRSSAGSIKEIKEEEMNIPKKNGPVRDKKD